MVTENILGFCILIDVLPCAMLAIFDLIICNDKMSVWIKISIALGVASVIYLVISQLR